MISINDDLSTSKVQVTFKGNVYRYCGNKRAVPLDSASHELNSAREREFLAELASSVFSSGRKSSREATRNEDEDFRGKTRVKYNRMWKTFLARRVRAARFASTNTGFSRDSDNIDGANVRLRDKPNENASVDFAKQQITSAEKWNAGLTDTQRSYDSEFRVCLPARDDCSTSHGFFLRNVWPQFTEQFSKICLCHGEATCDCVSHCVFRHEHFHKSKEKQIAAA